MKLVCLATALGLLLAVSGELSWLNLIIARALFLVPLTRFPGFVWLIATGFALPRALDRATPPVREPALAGTPA
jgi:hypothetical protein